jgi:hypothetical protein
VIRVLVGHLLWALADWLLAYAARTVWQWANDPGDGETCDA